MHAKPHPWLLLLALFLAFGLWACPDGPLGSGDDDTAADDDDGSGDDDASGPATGSPGDDDDTPTPEPITDVSNSDVSTDFVAAAPETYSHVTGGGAFNDGTIGSNEDVVESLQGGDFVCGNLVTYLAAISVNDPIAPARLTVELDFRFAANTTGQPGAGLGDVTNLTVNYGNVANGAGLNGEDMGIVDDFGSFASIESEAFSPPGTFMFNGAEDLLMTARVTDLEDGEEVILRMDLWLMCQPGSSPSGNLMARLDEVRVVEADGVPLNPPQTVTGGAQTIPFQQVGDIGGLDP